MGTLGKSSGDYEYGFGVLLDAVINEPHKLKSIVASNREILVATNHSGENVLAWLVVENNIEGVKLLRGLGSPIPDFSLIEAIQMGYTEMVILLLELGVEIDIISCQSALYNELWGLNKKKISLIQSYFQQYGYEI